MTNPYKPERGRRRTNGGLAAAPIYGGKRSHSFDVYRRKKTFALELADAHKVVGSLGIEELSFEPDASCAALRGREIGYVLSRDHWGRGLIPEAVKAAMAYCFYGAGCDYLTIAHFDFNTQSRRVIEKCGFTYLRDREVSTPAGKFHALLYAKMRP